MNKNIFYIIFLSAVIVSCKTKIVSSSEVAVAKPSKEIIASYYENSFNEQTINARLKAVYKDSDNLQTITIKLRVEKDSVIWMSGTMLGIPLAKILITQSEVLFYEKLNKTYFKGDFELLSNFLGTKVDYDIVQNLLVGEALLDLHNKKHTVEVDNNKYLLAPKKQEQAFDILFWLNPQGFKVNKQEIRQPIEQQRLTVIYDEYQKVSAVEFPRTINISAVDKTNRTFIDLEYKSVEFNQKVSFPFNIPTGYKALKLDE